MKNGGNINRGRLTEQRGIFAQTQRPNIYNALRDFVTLKTYINFDLSIKL